MLAAFSHRLKVFSLCDFVFLELVSLVFNKAKNNEREKKDKVLSDTMDIFST